jgi:hypothetical protein
MRDNRIINMETAEIFSSVPTTSDPRSQGLHLDHSTTTAPANTFENDLKSFTYPAGAFTPFGGVRVGAVGNTLGSGGSKTVKLYFGGSALVNIPITNPGDSWRVEAEIFNAGGEAVQQYSIKTYRAGLLVGSVNGVLTVNTAIGPVTIKCTGQKTSAGDTITQTMFLVELIR